MILTTQSDGSGASPALVVAALSTVLRGQPGRNPVDNDDTTRHLSGRSVRVLAFGLAFRLLASRMTTRERAAGKLRRLILRLPKQKGRVLRLRSKPEGISLGVMKVKEKKSAKEQVPFDPILFAVTVPSRQPTMKDRADAKERPDDAIEPKDHPTLDAAVKDL